MILDTDKVMAGTLLKMDDAYAALRAVVADESVLNVDCGSMKTLRMMFDNAIRDVFETRNSIHEMKRFVEVEKT